MSIPEGFVLDQVISKPSEKSKKVAKSFKFFGYEPKAETIEPIRHQLMQKLVEPITEFTSAALGAPGDVLSLANEFIAKPISKKITGQEGQPFEETAVGKLIPTSQKLHQIAEQAAAEKLRPETTGEELLGTTAGFLGSMIGLGAKGIGKAGTIPFIKKALPGSVKTVLSAFAPASAFVAAKKADLPPWMQVGATIGTAALTHKLTNKSIPQISSELFETRNSLAKDVMMPGTPLANDLSNLYGEMQKGGTTSVEKHIMTFLDNIKSKAEGGDVPLEEILKARTKLMQESRMFTPHQRKGTEKFWNDAERILDNHIKKYENPEFQKINTEANSLYKGIKESKRIERFLGKHKKETLTGAGSLFLSHFLRDITGISLASPTTVLSIATGLKTYNFTRALIRNAGFRKAYKDVLKNASNENVRGTSRALKNFNHYYDKLQIDGKKEPQIPEGFELD
jgi:hypothetical protein